MKPYMAFSRSAGSEEGAILVVANTAKEAKTLAWGRCLNVEGWTDQGVRLIRDNSTLLLADQQKVRHNIPHVIDDPLSCEMCGLWGAGLTEDNKCGYCGEHPGDILIHLLRS